MTEANFKWRGYQMEDDPNGTLHQIENIVYLSNYCSALHQIINFGLYDQNKFYKVKNEYDLK